MHIMDCSCAPMLWFSLRRQMPLQQAAKFRTAFSGHFFYQCEEGQRDIASPIMHRLGRRFRHLLED